MDFCVHGFITFSGSGGDGFVGSIEFSQTSMEIIKNLMLQNSVQLFINSKEDNFQRISSNSIPLQIFDAAFRQMAAEEQAAAK